MRQNLNLQVARAKGNPRTHKEVDAFGELLSKPLVKYELPKYGDTENPVKDAHFTGDKICAIELENGTTKRVPIEAKPPAFAP